MNSPEYDEHPKEQKPLSEETKDLRDKLQRLGADFANYQKRALKDRESWSNTIVSQMIRRLVPALDSLDMLTQQCKGSIWEEGVHLVREEFLKALKQYGVSKIGPREGDKFNPTLHCCISVVDSPIEGEEIDFLIRFGYARGASVIRAADVIVRKNTQGSQ